MSKLYGKTKEYSSFSSSLLEDIRQHNSPSRLLDKLRKPVSKQSWLTLPQTINAYYSPFMNEIILPLGILRPPFYKRSRPDLLNFGGIGFSIGHELSHAFDDNGRKYNGAGDLESWWSEETLAKYREHVTCLVEQYGNLSLAGINLNGRSSLGENIADNGGLKAAYNAAFGDGSHDKNVFPVENLNLTAEQLFFVSFGHVWCNDNSQQYEINKILTNPHPPSRLRVIATLGNSEDFSSAFNCPKGSVMNPVKKCSLW